MTTIRPRAPMSGSIWRTRATALTLALATGIAHAHDSFDPVGEIDPFVERMVTRHGFDAASARALLGEARFLPDVVEAFKRPAESKAWREYRPIFLTRTRIEGGAEFWRTHRDTLERAEREYGVPVEITVAIIGVETLYGRRTGKRRVLDSLATLAFRYPRRSQFFSAELEQYLLLTQEEGLEPLSVKGSYAGAMGVPQFIASSYRRYAIDFDGDGVRDLLGSPADAIGSVANYLGEHGWRPGEPVVLRAQVEGERYDALLERGIKPALTVADMADYGVGPESSDVDAGRRAAFIELEGDAGDEHWLGFDNFYVITRYNHSKLYAMAVYQLAREIRREHEGGED